MGSKNGLRLEYLGYPKNQIKIISNKKPVIDFSLSLAFSIKIIAHSEINFKCRGWISISKN